MSLIKPRIAVPEHEMARKMAVKSTDVLLGAELRPTLRDALDGCAWAFATTARRGVSGIVTPRHAAHQAVHAAERGQRVAFVLGNEKTGLSPEDRALCAEAIRIPIAADKPVLGSALLGLDALLGPDAGSAEREARLRETLDLAGALQP